MRFSRTLLPLGLLMALLAGRASPAFAELSGPELAQVAGRLEGLEQELAALQRAIYQAGGANGGTGLASAGLGGAMGLDPTTERLAVRVDELEQEIRRLTGQVEELGFKIDQLTQKFEQYTLATNIRLDSLDGGTSSSASASSSAQPRPGTPISGNSAEEPGLAPAEGTLGTIQSGTAPPQEPEGTYQDQYNAALGLLRAQDYAKAEAAFLSFLARHGETDLAGPAMFWLGETYYAQGQFPKAAQTFLDCLKKYPDNPKAADAMLKLGMSLAEIGEVKQACLAFKDLPKKYPNASQTILQRAKVEADRAKCK